MAKHGIDVSKHQGVIDWVKVKASGKVDFTIIRAGFGKLASQKDTKFDRNYEGCVANKIPKGVYWYSYATTVNEAIQEANACLQILNGKTFEYPVYWDFEEKSSLNTGKANVSAMADAFCSTIEKAGYKSGIYSMKSGLESYITAEIKKKYTQWVANVNVSQTSYKGHDMWQYSWKGRIPGITGDVDCNYCYRDFTNPGVAVTPPTTTTTTTTTKKTNEEIAQEVLAGKWGNDVDRKNRLTEAGYDFKAIQAIVNTLVQKPVVATKTYTVKSGDTLSKIASKYGTTVKKIVNDNKTKYPQITPNFIKVGWVLKV